MLLLDVDVGDGALAADFLESVLDGGAVVWWVKGQGERLWSHRDIDSKERGTGRTDLIQLHGGILRVERVQQLLAGLAVGAVRLREDD